MTIDKWASAKRLLTSEHLQGLRGGSMKATRLNICIVKQKTSGRNWLSKHGKEVALELELE